MVPPMRVLARLPACRAFRGSGTDSLPAALLAVLLAVAPACAHTPSPAAAARLPTAAPAHAPVCSNPDLEAFRNEDIGFCLQVPPDAGMKDIRDPEHPNAVAQGPDETSIQVFVKDLGEKATPKACWSQLMEQVAAFSGDRPKSVEALQVEARKGIQHGSRRVFLAPFPRDEVCLFLVVEGPQESVTLERVAANATQTFQTGTPSAEFVTKLDLQRGFRMLQEKQFAAALHSFELVLHENPSLMPAQFGAGMAAYFAGPSFSKQAIEHLSSVLSAQSDSEEAERTLQPEQHQDTLMYLGLAYAGAKQYKLATSTLAELVDRYPDNATGRYNFACVLALSGDADGAMEQLHEAFDRDPKGELKAHAIEDDDLASLRHRPDWKPLVAGESAPHAQVPAPQ